MIKYYVKEYERVMRRRFPACSKAFGRLVEQSFTILDMKHEVSKFMFGKTKDFLKIAAKIGQDYYPEMLGKMFIINTGFAFKALWAIAKAFIDEKTVKKINIEGSSYLKVLLEYVFSSFIQVDKENLPALIGGTCTCSNIEGGCLYADIGPWNPEGLKDWN